jgi:hypothetical protein
MSQAYEYRVCNVQYGRVAFVNGAWGGSAPMNEDTGAALDVPYLKRPSWLSRRHARAHEKRLDAATPPEDNVRGRCAAVARAPEREEG